MAESLADGVLLRPAVAFPIEIYSDLRVAEFDEEEDKLKNHLKKKRHK
jgi:hypothetical protein